LTHKTMLMAKLPYIIVLIAEEAVLPEAKSILEIAIIKMIERNLIIQSFAICRGISLFIIVLCSIPIYVSFSIKNSLIKKLTSRLSML
jgi:hypothetical protein